ncbi:DUF4192 family protein [Arthrobacter sp. CDRTa11]|uniref:DUF4192 family protein n=1 Tax=Arthrobacter sp. CDRTa11 TaxID=2651199 RepID=UPI002265CE3D|nr:DUF4192 family protein [Arthrobacter sp. CDRTa11]UZX02719.1 DUF4192 family protein [Arthrobacter sp. CDRTa11]
MTPPEHLTVQGPEDVLGFIPHSLGYWPAESLVAMTLQGKRLGATLRLDLPGPGTLADPREFARTVRDYLRADQHADAALLVFFTNDGWMDLPHTCTYTGLLAALQAVLGTSGMPVRDAWYVGDRYWRDAYCSDQSCCPVPGRPIEEIRDSRLNAEMVYRGSSVGPAPDQHAQQPGSVSAEAAASLLAAEEEWSSQLDPRRGSRAQFEAVLGFWAGLLDSVPGDALPEAHLAFLRASLRAPAWRDAVLVMAAAGAATAQEGAGHFGIFDAGCLLAPVGPDPADPSSPPGNAPLTAGTSADISTQGSRAAGPDLPGYGEVLLGVKPVLPDWGRLNSLDRILASLPIYGGQAAAAALTGRGWIAWCRGRGSYAAAYLGQALQVEAEYRLAELMLELVRRGTLCGWAARKEAAWQRFQPDAA